MKTPYWFMHKTLLAFILVPFSWVYYGVSRAVFGVRKMRAYKSKRPVICIGNILAGGVGKTPIVREIATYLDAPVVMRGYKKSAHTGNIGDEATMLSRAGLIVHTGNRKSNVMLLDRQRDKSPIVMDDGLQNPTVEKNISIVVFDESIGFGNGFLLPAGPLREPRDHIANADAIMIVRSKNRKKNFTIPTGVPVFYATNQTISPYDEKTPIVAFAGIGYPKKFFACLNNVVARRAFPDHYQYTDADIEKLLKLAKSKKAKLVTTEKDWVRLPESVRDKIKFATLKTEIQGDFWNWLGEKLK
ncbi:MAG: tetraacyldisaccharide 4'-kinase [Alphaproteobacteria bacterium]|nr:tetraacyldisaccharide 4'-kinase [Alphaproteobacteria bacterium]